MIGLRGMEQDKKLPTDTDFKTVDHLQPFNVSPITVLSSGLKLQLTILGGGILFVNATSGSNCTFDFFFHIFFTAARQHRYSPHLNLSFTSKQTATMPARYTP